MTTRVFLQLKFIVRSQMINNLLDLIEPLHPSLEEATTMEYEPSNS